MLLPAKTSNKMTPFKMAWWKHLGVAGVLSVAVLCLISFAIGWILPPPTVPEVTPRPLRATGYAFISPLLSCNFNALKVIPEAQTISDDITKVIQQHEQAGDITKASTFFGDFATSAWSDTFQNETYYPSSITKIPIMMAYLAMAESSSTVLDTPITYPAGSSDLNDAQETKPEASLVPGQTYTVEELIEHMIKYSDNNAAALLFNALDPNTLREVYTELNIPINPDPTVSNLDFITPTQVSILFRVLYNSTYLSRDDSERALDLLSQTTFTEGLVAGVPTGTTVSHKFGVVGIVTDGVETGRELHDCGIVYAPGHPYTLCVMTRGTSGLTSMESVISDISKTVYEDVENGKE